nr:putative ribonuclease H-like domain-containing protein [Tanacetum cinerariifolium]
MSRDMLTIDSTMRIPLLYQGEYLQWVERFMNYLEEQMDEETMFNSIKNGDQPLPRITQVSIAGTSSTEQPPLKDKFMCNKTAKDLCDALARHMLGSEYGEQDRKAAVLYEYETFKATEGELLLDTYIRYLQVINDLKKCGYSKDKCELIFKFLNNLQPEWKQYATMMRHNKNLMDINIILKQNQGDVNDAMGSKKKIVVVTSDPLALIAEKTNVSRSKEKVFVSSDSEGSEADDFSELKKITTLLAKAFNRRKFYSKPTNNNLRTSSSSQSANKKQEFVKTDNKRKTKVSKSKEKVVVSSDSEGSEADDFNELKKITALLAKAFNRRKFYSKPTNNNLRTSSTSQSANKKQEFVKSDDKQVVKKADEKSEMKQIADQEVLYDKMSVQLVELDKHDIGQGYTLMFLTHSDEALEIKKFKRSRENKIEFAYDYGNLNASYVYEKINFEDDYFQEIINLDFEKIDSPFQQTSSLKPYVSNVILEKIIINLEDEVVNLLEKEKVNLETIESFKSKDFESSEKDSSESENQSKNDCLVVEKECDKEENPKVIAPGIFKLSVSQCVSPISMSKLLCESNNVEIKLKRKRCKRKSSKQNVKQVDNDVSRANSDFVHFLDLDTFSSVRRPKNSGVVWKKKWSSNTSIVDLSAVRISNLNKNVKRYSRKDLLACINYHLGETTSAYMCNDAMNVSCDSRMNDFLDDNNFFIFDDESVKISPVSKMPFRKKPCDSMNVHSKSNMIKYLPRTMCKWLPKMQPLAEPHMTGNRALLTNFMEKFLGTVRFGNNDFAVIAGYGDVVIGSMTIKKVYYVEGLGHNLFSIEVAFRKSTCFVWNEDGVDLLTGDRSSNLYTIALNKVASNSPTCLLAKASSSQTWLWHQHLSHLNFAIIDNLMKNNLIQGLPKMKFEKYHLCSACEQGKIHRKHHKSNTTFASNKPLYLLHMDLCGPIRIQSINGKRYVLVVVDDYSRYTWVFFLHSKDESSEVKISFIKKTQVNLQLQVQRV